MDAIAHALRMGVRIVELDVWDGDAGEPKVYHGHTMTKPISFVDSVIAVRDNGFLASSMPVCITLENHCTLPFQEVMVKHLEEILGDKLYIPDDAASWTTYPSPEDMHNKVIIRGKAKAKKKHGEAEEPEALLIPDADSDSDSDGEKEEKKKEKRPKFHPSLVRLMALRNAHLHKEQLAEPGPIASTCSINEKKCKKLGKKYSTELVNYTKRHIVRAYPGALRIDSSNTSPHRAWAHGCQFAALNYQANDTSVWINNGMFRDNGGCGYVLKPDWMRAPEISPVMHPVRITVKLISGHYLPKPGNATKGEIIDPYVNVIMTGVKEDEKTFVSRTIDDNGFNPTRDETFTFEVSRPDIAVLLFTVWDKDVTSQDDFIGQVHFLDRCHFASHCSTTHTRLTCLLDYSRRPQYVWAAFAKDSGLSI